jgi:hypothetical protein
MLFREAWRQPSTGLEIFFALRESEDQLPSPAGHQVSTKCLIDEIWLSKGGQYLTFRLYKTHFLCGHNFDNEPSVEWELSNANRLVRTRRGTHTPSLMGVWDCTPIQERLLILLSPLPPVVEVDLDRRVTSERLPSLAQVNRKFRILFLERRLPYEFWTPERNQVAFKINITTQESISTFARFIGLIEWITGGRPQQFDYWDRPRWYGKTLRISLNFDLDVHTPLEDLRFEVTDLVFNSFSLSPETSLLVQQPLHGGKTCTRPVERGCSTLYRLRRALLVFLSEIMASHQGLEPGPFPQVWADGKLRPREASFTLTNGGTKIVTNKKYLLSSNQLNKEKNPALSRLAPQKVDHEWESCSCPYPCYGPRASQDGTELYETVLSGTSFLARFVKQSQHPEAYRMPRCRFGRSQVYEQARQSGWMFCCHAASWKDLRKLRPN